MAGAGSSAAMAALRRQGTLVSSHSLSSGHWNGAFGCACVCEAKARLHRGRARLGCAGGFRHGRATAAKHRRRCLGLGVGLQPKLASVEGPGEDSGAHRGSSSKGGPAQDRRQCRGRAVAHGGVGEEAAAGRLRFLDSADRPVEFLRGSHGGQVGLGCSDCLELPRRSRLPAAGALLWAGARWRR